MAKHTSWDNRTAFILAAIGSAIGLGNIWRFPYIAYKYGGGAFLIPYLVALVTAGIPLLILEFAIGHKMRQSAPGAFYKARKNTEWIGWFALLVGFGIVCYYAVIMAWSGRYLIASFTQAWGTAPVAVESFFFNKILGLTSGPFQLGKVAWPLLAILAVAWVWVILSIWKGAKTVSKVVWVTVILPWVILLVFLVRGVTLPGAAEGLRYFLTPNLAALSNPEVWHAAYSQIFFSLTVGFGVMIAYASFLPRKSDVVNNAIIIGLADAGTAFAGGIVVFSTLGYYAGVTGQPVADVVTSGPGLAFVTYPMIINKLPLSPVFGVLFFLMLLTLAVDSAFSLVEGGAAGILDRFKKAKRWVVLIGMAVVAFIVGIIYVTGAGLYWLDIVDHFMNNFGLFLVALLECFVVAWIWRSHHLRRYCNLRSEVKVGRLWEGMVQWFVPAVTLLILAFTVVNRMQKPYPEPAAAFDTPVVSAQIGGQKLDDVLVELKERNDTLQFDEWSQWRGAVHGTLGSAGKEIDRAYMARWWQDKTIDGEVEVTFKVNPDNGLVEDLSFASSTLPVAELEDAAHEIISDLRFERPPHLNPSARITVTLGFDKAFGPFSEFLGGWLLIGLLALIAIALTRMDWWTKIRYMIIPILLIGIFYGLRFFFTGTQSPLFTTLWWAGVGVLAELALLFSKMKRRRKITLMIAIPALVVFVFLIALILEAGKPELFILILSSLILYGGIIMFLMRSASHQRKLKRGEIKPPPDADEDDDVHEDADAQADV